MTIIYTYGKGWNGQHSRIAVLIDDNSIIVNCSSKLTKNEAEYRALIFGLDMAEEGDTIYIDSRLVYGQVKLGWKINSEYLKVLNDKVKERLKTKNVNIIWIPKEENLARKMLEKE